MKNSRPLLLSQPVVILGLTIAFFLAVGTAFFSVFSIREVSSSGSDVARIQTTLLDINRLLTSLINAETDQPVAGYDPIPSGANVNLAILPTRNLNIRANTSPATVGSVRFGWTGNATSRTDDTAPYSIGGDDAGDYVSWTPATGNHTLTGTPYAGTGATGTAGTAQTLSFKVTDKRRGKPQ